MFRSKSAQRLPPEVEDALCEIFGSAVRRVRLVPHSWFARLHAGADATTRRNVIYLRRSIAAFAADPALMLHEYFHVIHQWRSHRLTLRRYVMEWLKHGYWNNRFEREARDFTSAHLLRVMVILQKGERPAPLAMASGRYFNAGGGHALQGAGKRLNPRVGGQGAADSPQTQVSRRSA